MNAPLNSQSEGVDSGIVCLLLICQYLRIACEYNTIRHDLGLVSQFASTSDLVRAALRLKLKARSVKTSPRRIDRLPLPIIITKTDGTFAVLAARKHDLVIVHDPLKGQPVEMTVDELGQIWTGEAIFITRRIFAPNSIKRFDIYWFIPEIKKHSRSWAEILFLSLIINVIGLFSPIFFQVIIDKVLVNNAMSTLTVVLTAIAAAALFDFILSIIRTYLTIYTTSRIDITLGAKLFHHLLRLPMSYFSSRETGQTVARIHELERIRSFITGSGLTIIIDCLFLFVFLAVMFVYSVWLSFVVLASIPCYLLLSILVTPGLRRRAEERFARGADNQTFLVESVVGVETLKAMAVEPQMQRRWEDQLAGYVRATFRLVNFASVGSSLAQLINRITTLLILGLGAKAVINGNMTVGQLVAFNMFAARVADPILRISNLWQDFQQVKISIERLGDILNSPTEIIGGSGSGQIPSIEGSVTFEHVSFRYKQNETLVLDDINIEIAPGEIIGIVGPSGSGKSTIAKLIQRFYVPSNGRITVDGTDLALIDPSSLRRQVGVVLQDSILFKRTVRENIALADPAIAFERVVQAAKLAGAHDFILKLPYGYDTVLEERGSNLSGGQRQRIAIARSLVSNPKVLIFDEATSALDYESEYAIQQNLREISRGRTVFIIAHRLAALRVADRLIVLENGRIAERGSHQQLLKANGRYTALFRLQEQADQESSA